MNKKSEINSTRKIEGLRPYHNCRLLSLKKGDIVLIKHAHKFEYGCWDDWVGKDYKYLGFKSGEYHFERIKHNHEHFRMKSEIEPSHRFKGKYFD